MIDEREPSPKWSTTTKLVVALTLTAVTIALLYQFRNIVGPLLMAFVLAYLVSPAAERINQRLKLPWRFSVLVIFVLIVVLILGLLTWGGFTIVEQVQSLIGLLQNAINDLPATIEDISHRVYEIGPFVVDFSRIDLMQLSTQILGVVQGILTRMGLVVTTFASSAATSIGWFFFMILISYFILAETGGRSTRLIYLHIPGYEADLDRMGTELGRIWNAFVRGQFTIIAFTVLLYTFLLGVLGVRFYFGLALVAGAARFVPYIGPLVAWTTYGLVAYFQGYTIFGLPPLTYTLIVVGIAYITDNIIDSFISPRIMADALAVHPAAVLVAVLVGANLFGFIGVILAAPVLASLKLLLNYAVHKLSDRDPWENVKAVSPPQPVAAIIAGIRRAWRVFVTRVTIFAAWSKGKVIAIARRHPRNPPVDPR